MPDIFDEVEEDLRADRARRLLLRYGGVLVAAAVGVVLAVAGYQALHWYQDRQAAKVAVQFVDGAHAADLPSEASHATAGPLLANVAAKGASGYRTLARLRQAALLASTDLGAADALWQQVADDTAADPLLRDVANLQWALHNLDSGDPAAVGVRLRPLAVASGPWHGLAAEGQAMLALRLGHAEEARDTLRLLVQDTAVPQGVRRRASGLLEQLGPDAKAAS